MGVGPIEASKKALAKAGLTIDELNAYRSAAINGTPAALNASDYVTQYTLTQHLTDCTSNAAGTEISEGAALSVTITPNAGKKLGSISVTMGGTDITATAVSGSTVHIASVTGNVVITAVATAAARRPQTHASVPTAMC